MPIDYLYGKVPIGPRKPRLLVTGAGGQLGRALRIAEPDWAEVISLESTQLDITDLVATGETIERLRPDWVVNTAAFTAVDRAEHEQARAFSVNAQGAAILAEACRKASARMVQLSTDYVFDGAKSSPYLATDATNPLNVYGRSKLAGEQKVQEILGDRSLILRTAWVYSLKGPSFVTTMLRLMRERESIQVVDDQIGTPTSAFHLARTLLVVIQHELVGVHHWTNAGVASWYDFAVAIKEEAVARGIVARDITIVPIPTDGYPTAARRPRYSILDKTVIRSSLTLPEYHWRDALRELFDQP